MSGKSKAPVKFVSGGPLLERAMATLREFQRDRKAPLTCPSCGSEGLQVIDRSARPFSEWYAFSCASCGLEDAIHLPNAAHRSL